MDANRREFLAAAGVTALAGARSATRQDRLPECGGRLRLAGRVPGPRPAGERASTGLSGQRRHDIAAPRCHRRRLALLRDRQRQPRRRPPHPGATFGRTLRRGPGACRRLPERRRSGRSGVHEGHDRGAQPGGGDLRRRTAAGRRDRGDRRGALFQPAAVAGPGDPHRRVDPRRGHRRRRAAVAGRDRRGSVGAHAAAGLQPRVQRAGAGGPGGGDLRRRPPAQRAGADRRGAVRPPPPARRPGPRLRLPRLLVAQDARPDGRRHPVGAPELARSAAAVSIGQQHGARGGGRRRAVRARRAEVSGRHTRTSPGRSAWRPRWTSSIASASTPCAATTTPWSPMPASGSRVCQACASSARWTAAAAAAGLHLLAGAACRWPRW